MEIVNVPPGDLKPAEYNPRKMTKDQKQDLENSIAKFGFVDPIIVNKAEGRENIVVGGHQRLRIALEMGMETVPVYFVDLSIDDEQELNLRLNKNMGEFDWDLLVNFDSDMLLDVGFSEEELNFNFDIEPEEKDDEVPNVPEQPKAKLGDVYQLGEHRLMCGDATVKESVVQLMSGQKADMVFTDPPYGINYQSNMRTKTKKFDVLENDSVFITKWLEYLDDFSIGFVFIWTTWKVLDRWLQETSILGDMSNMIIWDKGGGGIGDLEKTFSTDYEIALVWHRGCKLAGKRLGSVWSIGKDSVSDYKHPTQKPIELAATAIKTTTGINDKVLDLFGGSGSTLIACEKTNRKCYMMELDPKYIDVIIERWENYTGKEAQKLT